MILLPLHAESSLEEEIEMLYLYGVNPSYEELQSIKAPYGFKKETDYKGTGRYAYLPNGTKFEIREGDEKYLERVAHMRHKIREMCQKYDHPISFEPFPLILQRVFLDDRTATVTSISVVDELEVNLIEIADYIERDWSKKMTLWSFKKDLALYVGAFINLRYIYIGERSGLTVSANIKWNELLDYYYEHEDEY